MKATGFTFIKNAILFDYPIVEAIQSILPLCDQVVVAVGKSEDDTRALIESIHPKKIAIIDTVWDETMREGGKVLAVETDKAFAAIPNDSDWAFYIQGDEVVHEADHPKIRQAMEDHLSNPKVDGLLFKYCHFYGSYDYLGSSSQWYRNEIRIVRKRKDIFSYQDAQGFRKGQDQKLNVKAIDAHIHHYGWVKHPRAMQLKQKSFQKHWHSDSWIDKNVEKGETFNYLNHINELSLYTGTHPKVMQERIDQLNWQFDFDISMNRKTIKEQFKDWCYQFLGLDFNYKNYRLI